MKDTVLSEPLPPYIRQHGLELIIPSSLGPHLALCGFENGEAICRQGETSRYLYIVEAVSPVVMVRIPYRELGSEHAPLLRFLLDIITRKFSLKSQFMSFNLIYPVEVRLASYLLSVSFDENDSGFRGRLSAKGLTDAANLIGTSYRRLNRVLRQFADEGMIERSREHIVVLDREGLRERANHNIYEQKPERME